MKMTTRYRRALRAAVDAYKSSRANRRLKEKSSSPNTPPPNDTSDSQVPRIPPVRRRGPRQKANGEATLRRARRKAVRTHFDACKAARADSVRQAHRGAVNASLGASHEESNANDAAEAAIQEAEWGAKKLIRAYGKVVLRSDEHGAEDRLSRLSEIANDTHLFAKRAAESSELVQRAADNAARGVEAAGACSALARHRAEQASDKAAKAAMGAILTGHEYARLRAKEGPPSERKLARAEMRNTAKRIRRISYNMSQSLRDASEQNRLRSISFSRWPFRMGFGLFKLSNFLWECVFLLIDFVIDVVRSRRFEKEEWNASQRSFAAAKAHAKKKTDDPDPSLEWATRSEFAFEFGAIESLVRNVELAAEEEADAANHERFSAEKAANAANLLAAFSKDVVGFAEYCAARADLLEARNSIDPSGKIVAPAALRLPFGWEREEESVHARAWALFLRAEKSAAEKLQRAKRLAEHRVALGGATSAASRPNYEVSRHMRWLERLGKAFVTPRVRLLFAEAKRENERADLAACAYYAACAAALLSRVGALAEKAASVKSKSEFRSRMQDALSMFENTDKNSEWAAEQAVETKERLSIPDYASARATGLIAGFPELAEYAKEARARTKFVKETFTSLMNLEDPKVGVREARVKARDAAELVYRAAAIEHEARLKVLSRLVSLHREGILESVASQRAFKKAFFERLNGYIRVAEHAETEGARIFKAAGLDYRVQEGLVERARQLKEEAAEGSDDGYFGDPWTEKFLKDTVPEHLARVVDSYNAKRKQYEAEAEKEKGADTQGNGSKTNGCVGSLEVEFDELAEMIKCIEEIHGNVRYFGDMQRIASNSRYLARESMKYAREARDLSN